MQQTNLNEDFINEVIQLIEVERKSFSTQQTLSNYANWDSLAVVSMIAIVDQYFAVKMSGREIETCHTLDEILTLAKKKQVELT